MVPVATTVVGVEQLERAVNAKPVALDRLDVALLGWRLRLRDQFDELLCLARLSGLRRLGRRGRVGLVLG